MTTCLGKSSSFGLLCVSCVGVCQFVGVDFEGGMSDLIV